MKVVVAFSGGKDSQASLIWAVNRFGQNNVVSVFCDTKWEHDLTYKHINEVVIALGVTHITISSSKYDGFVDLAKKKGRFPSAKARFCTEELKTKPMIDWVLDQSENLLIVQGIRKDESNSRSKMDKECRFFKYYLEPFNDAGKKFTYRKKEVLAWIKNYSDDILRPVFDWSGQQVIDYILQNGQNPNPLYYKGFSRVGCMPCIMCRLGEIKQMAKELPESAERLLGAENEVGTTFFSTDDIPFRYRTGIDKKTGQRLTTAPDMLKYVSENPNQTSLIKEDSDRRCMSFYGLCE